MAKSGAAYDFERFQRQQIPLRVVENKNPKKKAASRIGVAPVRIILATVMLVAILSYMLYAQAMLTQINEQVNQYSDQLSTLQSETTRLELSLKSRMSLKNIEEYASEELGLEKLEKYQIEYVRLTEGDTIRMAQQEPTVWENILESIKGFLGISE